MSEHGGYDEGSVEDFGRVESFEKGLDLVVGAVGVDSEEVFFGSFLRLRVF